jgi:hypothetical protein
MIGGLAGHPFFYPYGMQRPWHLLLRVPKGREVQCRSGAKY